MYVKKWIILFFIAIILIGVVLQLFLTIKNIPLRFSNSISADAKLDFIYKKNLLKDADTLVFGSSMALNNINGITLENESKKIHKVANMASWGLDIGQNLKLLQLINLQNVKRIILSTGYSDFNVKHDYNFDYKSIEDILHNHFTLQPYFIRFTTAMKNIEKYYYYEELYHNVHSYKSLVFDRTGSANLDFMQKDINKKRWNNNAFLLNSLLDSSFNALIKIAKICRNYHIEFIVVTSPIRISILNENPNIRKNIETMTHKLKVISRKENFTYIDTHTKFKCKGLCFVDSEHLNKNATIIYTNLILEESGLQ